MVFRSERITAHRFSVAPSPRVARSAFLHQEPESNSTRSGPEIVFERIPNEDRVGSPSTSSTNNSVANGAPRNNASSSYRSDRFFPARVTWTPFPFQSSLSTATASSTNTRSTVPNIVIERIPDEDRSNTPPIANNTSNNVRPEESDDESNDEEFFDTFDRHLRFRRSRLRDRRQRRFGHRFGPFPDLMRRYRETVITLAFKLYLKEITFYLLQFDIIFKSLFSLSIVAQIP